MRVFWCGEKETVGASRCDGPYFTRKTFIANHGKQLYPSFKNGFGIH